MLDFFIYFVRMKYLQFLLAKLLIDDCAFDVYKL